MSTVDQPLWQVAQELGLTTSDLASALGVSARTVNRWRTGDSRPRPAARAKLVGLAEVRDHMFLTFEDEGVPIWLRTPSRYLGGVTPTEMPRLGRVERVEAALVAIDAGFFV
jgi:transcriptional regulator with XRE-family HTH domain